MFQQTVQSPEYAGKANLRKYESSQVKKNHGTYEKYCFDPENATPDSQLLSNKEGRIVNESSLFGEEVHDYILDDDDDEDFEELKDVDRVESSSDDHECVVNEADDVMSLSVISKSINTSYINLKRHNPWQNGESGYNGNEAVDHSPELIKPQSP